MKKTRILVITILGLIGILLLSPLFVKEQVKEDAIIYTDTYFIEPHYDKTPLEFGLTFLGEKEKFSDGTSNPVVLSFFRDFADWVTDTEVAWCAAYINSIYASTGYEYSGKLNARSFLKVGEIVLEPRVGDLVIFWRESPKSWKGHVGIFLNYSSDGRYIYVLGGNQSDMVTVSKYLSSRLLGFRRPEKIVDWDQASFLDSIPPIEISLK